MIDSRAIVDSAATLGDLVSVGPWSHIGPEVEIGEGTVIGPHVVIKGPTKIGRNNKIYQFSSIGDDPQCISYQGEKTYLEIGDNNTIREFCTLNRGTQSGSGKTRMGSHNYLMAYAHIAHDCEVGNHIVFANNAALAGHVRVDDYAGFGGFSAVHQHCNIGSYSFVSGATSVVKDVPPYVLVSGHPGKVYGLNLVGLKRRGFSEKQIAVLQKAYNIIYREGLTVPRALAILEAMIQENPEIQILVTALNQSTRGIVR